MAKYTVNAAAVDRAERLISAKQYVLNSDWGEVQPRAAAENAYLKSHGWPERSRSTRSWSDCRAASTDRRTR